MIYSEELNGINSTALWVTNKSCAKYSGKVQFCPKSLISSDYLTGGVRLHEIAVKISMREIWVVSKWWVLAATGLASESVF
jgi:hypothetical protein